MARARRAASGETAAQAASTQVRDPLLREEIDMAGAGLRSISEPWADTTSPAGKMILTVFGGIAEFERSLI